MDAIDGTAHPGFGQIDHVPSVVCEVSALGARILTVFVLGRPPKP
jgi:hypothetical protein